MKSFLAALGRRKITVGAAFVCVASLTAAASLGLPRDFTSTASILAAPERTAGAQTKAPDAAVVETLVNAEVAYLNSRDLAAEIVESLQLADDPVWREAAAERGRRFRLMDLAPPEWREERSPKTSAQQALRAPVLETVDDAIVARRRGRSYVIEISVTAPTAEFAAKLANAVAGLAIARNGLEEAEDALRQDQAAVARADALRAEVARREAELEAARRPDSAVLPQVVLESAALRTEMETAETALAEAESRFAQLASKIASGQSIADVAASINSEGMRALRLQQAELVREQAALEERYGELHPAVGDGRAAVTRIAAQIEAEVRRVLETYRQDMALARARVAGLSASLQQTAPPAPAVQTSPEALSRLEAAVAAARSDYGAALAALERDARPAIEVRPVSAASAPKRPNAPEPLQALLGALIGGLVAGVLAGLLSDWLDRSFRSAEDVLKLTGLAPLTSVPVLSARQFRNLPPLDRHPAGFLVHYPMSAYAESLRVLRAPIGFGHYGEAGLCLCITSALPGEGKTTLALSLARVSAMAGHKVLIIDCDTRRRSLNDLFEIDPRQGLIDVLRGEARWEDLIGRDPASNACILPIAAHSATLEEAFQGEAMRDLLAEVRRHFDLVILDAPPVLVVAEARTIARLADSTVMVVRWGKTSVKTVRDAMGQVNATGTKILGVALNWVDPHAPGRSSSGDSIYLWAGEESYYAR